VVVTWWGGSPNAGSNEMRALADREIILWPDNDQAGRNAMRRFAVAALRANARTLLWVDVPRELGEKWDLADPIPSMYAEASPQELLDTARPLSAADVY